jgi:hypothetical protein
MTKEERIEDILEILDLADEVEQRRRIAILMNVPPWRHNFVAGFFPEDSQKCDKCGKKLRIKEDYDEGCPYTYSYSGSLADLAFKLRDEAKEYQTLAEALELVWDYWQGQNRTGLTFDGFWIHRAQPIYWIVASLIGRELSEKEV